MDTFKAIMPRFYDINQTLGSLYILKNDKLAFACDTLELVYKNNERKVSCFIAGKYLVNYRWSEAYGHHYYITGIPNRDLCLFHAGNFAGSNNPRTKHPDVEGCTMVGNGYKDINNDGIFDIIDSTNAMKKMFEIVGKNSFWLTVI